MVGAPFDDIGAKFNQVSAYVFVKPGTGWADMTETAKLTASDRAAFDNFGDSVAISGDTVVVGAVNDDIGGQKNQGSAYLFVEPGTGWAGTLNETAKLMAPDAAPDAWFGGSVAIAGGKVAVGAHGYDGHRGSAYVFDEPSASRKNSLSEDGLVRGRW